MSEALRLADLLEPCCLTIGDGQQAVAAAELRRLAAVEQELEALKRAISEAEPVAWQWLDTANFRKKIPAGATSSHWTPLYTLKGIK